MLNDRREWTKASDKTMLAHRKREDNPVDMSHEVLRLTIIQLFQIPTIRNAW